MTLGKKGDYTGGPPGKAAHGWDWCLTGKTSKPRKFMTWKIDNKWHWWNRRAAFEMCRDLQSVPASELSVMERSLLEPLELAFGKQERRAA